MHHENERRSNRANFDIFQQRDRRVLMSAQCETLSSLVPKLIQLCWNTKKSRRNDVIQRLGKRIGKKLVLGGKFKNLPISSAPLRSWFHTEWDFSSVENTGENSHETVAYSRAGPLSLIHAFFSSVLPIVLALFLPWFRHSAALVLVHSHIDPWIIG